MEQPSSGYSSCLVVGSCELRGRNPDFDVFLKDFLVLFWWIIFSLSQCANLPYWKPPRSLFWETFREIWDQEARNWKLLKPVLLQNKWCMEAYSDLEQWGKEKRGLFRSSLELFIWILFPKQWKHSQTWCETMCCWFQSFRVTMFKSRYDIWKKVIWKDREIEESLLSFLHRREC